MIKPRALYSLIMAISTSIFFLSWYVFLKALSSHLASISYHLALDSCLFASTCKSFATKFCRLFDASTCFSLYMHLKLLSILEISSSAARFKFSDLVVGFPTDSSFFGLETLQVLEMQHQTPKETHRQIWLENFWYYNHPPPGWLGSCIPLYDVLSKLEDVSCLPRFCMHQLPHEVLVLQDCRFSISDLINFKKVSYLWGYLGGGPSNCPP